MVKTKSRAESSVASAAATTGERRIAVVAAYDRTPLGELPLVGWAVAERYLNEAMALHQNHARALPAWQRREILDTLADAVESEGESFALLIAREGGKPVRDARIEVSRAVAGIRYAAGAIAHLTQGREIAPDLTPAFTGKRMSTSREPVGVIFAISAFNHPLNLIVHQVVPAIAVGAPVIVKPALSTPLTCLRLVALLEECGLPDGWCRALLCDNDVAEKLAGDPRIALLNFIGSAAVGWRLKSQLAPGVACLLEHGGNAPVIVLPYADQQATIAALLKGGMAHAGQVCVSVQRVYVPWVEAAHFSRKLADAAEALLVGNPLNDNTDIGPLIHPREVARVHGLVQDALGSGAKLMCGGEPISETCYQPTILLDAPSTARVTTEEIFGPVICVYGYDELDDAVARANDSKYAFQAAVFGREISAVNRAAARLRAATIVINDHTALRVDHMPFGGFGHSGYGKGGLADSMAAYQREKLRIEP